MCLLVSLGEALSRWKPASAGTSRDNVRALGHHKNTVCVTAAQSNCGMDLTEKQMIRIRHDASLRPIRLADQSTRRHIAQDLNHQHHRCEMLKSRTSLQFLFAYKRGNQKFWLWNPDRNNRHQGGAISRPTQHHATSGTVLWSHGIIDSSRGATQPCMNIRTGWGRGV
jgi:hypothetical protein